MSQERQLLQAPVNVRISVALADPAQREQAFALLERFTAPVGDAAFWRVPPVEGPKEMITVLWST